MRKYFPDTGHFGNINKDPISFAKSVRRNFEEISLILNNVAQGNSGLAVSSQPEGGGDIIVQSGGSDFVRIWRITDAQKIENNTYGAMGLELSITGSLDIDSNSVLNILE